MAATAQTRAALVRANEVRAARGVARRALMGAVTRGEAMKLAAEHIADPASELEGMQVSHLLTACRQIGVSSVRRLFRTAAIPADALIRSLTDRQRDALVDALRCGDTVARPRRLNPDGAKAWAATITAFCPKCEQDCVPMDDGKCGWCSTLTIKGGPA